MHWFSHSPLLHAKGHACHRRHVGTQLFKQGLLHLGQRVEHLWGCGGAHLQADPAHRITQNHTESHRITQNHTESHRITQNHTESHRITQNHTESHRITQNHTESHRITQNHTESHRITQNHTESHRITQNHTESHRITQNHTESHRAAGWLQQQARHVPSHLERWCSAGMLTSL